MKGPKPPTTQQRRDLDAFNAACRREREEAAEAARQEAERQHAQRLERIAHALLIIIFLVSISAGIWLAVKS